MLLYVNAPNVGDVNLSNGQKVGHYSVIARYVSSVIIETENPYQADDYLKANGLTIEGEPSAGVWYDDEGKEVYIADGEIMLSANDALNVIGYRSIDGQRAASTALKQIRHDYYSETDNGIIWQIDTYESKVCEWGKYDIEVIAHLTDYVIVRTKNHKLLDMLCEIKQMTIEGHPTYGKYTCQLTGKVTYIDRNVNIQKDAYDVYQVMGETEVTEDEAEEILSLNNRSH